MYKDLDLILSLKSKNPFVVLLFSFGMIGCYLLILGLLIFEDVSFHKILGLSIFLFLFFYSIALLSSIHYIYTSFRYKSIHIYDNNRIILNEKKIYGDVTVTYNYISFRGCISSAVVPGRVNPLADISFTPAQLDMNYTPADVSLDWQINENTLSFQAGSVHMKIVEYAHVDIEYLGGPMYVPPSADPNKKEQE